jgi:hypothetical protein
MLLCSSVLFAVLVYAGVLMTPLPCGFARFALPSSSGLLVLVGVLYLVYRPSGMLGRFGSLTVTLVVFALPLVGYWNNWGNGLLWASIGGLVPFADAMLYYLDAQRLLEGDLFSVFSGRRPLFPGLLATVMGLAHQNLQVTLAVIVLIVATCCFLLGREIRRTHGPVAAVIVTVMLFSFYRGYAGTTMSEHLGVALGSLSLAIVWRGAGEKRIKTVFFGILLLTLALCARAGAFLILPAFVLWVGRVFRYQGRLSLRILLGGCGVIMLGFLLNLGIGVLTSTPNSAPFANFSSSLYGIASGGQGWYQVVIDHPELASVNINDPEQSRKIFGLTFELVTRDPGRLVLGILRGWRDYLDPVSPTGAFSFVEGGGGVAEMIKPLEIGGYGKLEAHLFLYALTLLGIVYCCRHWDELHNSLVLVAFLGILLSVPFAPPRDAPWMRAYAATIPFSAVLIAMGATQMLMWLPNKIQRWFRVPIAQDTSRQSAALIYFGIAVAAFTILGPIGVKYVSKAPQLTKVPCPSNQEARYLRITHGSIITLVSDASMPRTRFHIPLSQFHNELRTVGQIVPAFAEELATLDASTIIMPGLDLSDRSRGVYLVAKSGMVPEQSSIVRVCGTAGTNMIFYADSIRPVSTCKE